MALYPFESAGYVAWPLLGQFLEPFEVTDLYA